MDGDGIDEKAAFLRKFKVKKSESLWLMSFSDLSFVLLCFFVLLFSFSKPNQKRFENVIEGMKAQDTSQMQEANLSALSKKVEHVIRKRKLDRVANVTYDANGLAVEFKDGLLFASGSAVANPRYKKIVEQVMGVIAEAPVQYQLVFEGHTDDIPVRGGPYKSNWELSAARGVTLLRSFKKRGVPESRMSIAAFAHTRPKIPVQGLKGRKLRAARAANRRVVIRIE